MVNINEYIKALLHPAGGHQGSYKAHQAGNQMSSTNVEYYVQPYICIKLALFFYNIELRNAESNQLIKWSITCIFDKAEPNSFEVWRQCLSCMEMT